MLVPKVIKLSGFQCSFKGNLFDRVRLPLDVPIVDGPFPHSSNTFKILQLFNSN